MVLCGAWLAVSGDAAVGTDQRVGDFYIKVREAWIVGMRGRGAGLNLGADRSVGSVNKTWHAIKKGVSAFASHFLAVQKMELTGNPTEEELIVGALARYEGKDVYETIIQHRAAAVKAQPPAGKRKKNALRKFVPCWQELRGSDKWSGAAGAAAAGLPAAPVTDESDTDSDAPSTPRGNLRQAKAFNRRPQGSQAAKRAKREDNAMKTEMAASTAALAALAQASRERTAVAFFNLPEMRESPEAALFLQGQARKMLEAVGLGGKAKSSTVSAPVSGASGEGSWRDSGGSVQAGAGTGGMGGAVGPAVFEILDGQESEGRGTGASGSGTPAADTAAPPAGSAAAAPAAGAAALPAPDAAVPPAVGGHGLRTTRGAKASRGTKAQLTKAAAAAAALSKALEGTTIDVDGVPPPPASSDEDSEGFSEEDDDEEDSGSA